ncbi:hypothetical protein DNTS_014009 [Danionella cerebrum]|uniref:Ribonuclease P protein subunit p29 n=2 Tax=Danionella cerebrum TaxID=2873325 RepID=A0A553N5A6_9TELE|nr:hypothetical protein DNTS_014009 [Danionella translucida]
MEQLVQSRIPPDQRELLGVESQNREEANAFTKAFLKNSIPKMTNAALEAMMEMKAVILEYKRQKKKKGKAKKAKGLNAKEKRRLKIFQLKPEHQKYELFLPLHELWKQYVEDLCNGLKPGSNPQVIQQKLLKADFHGAILTVIPKRNSVFSVEIGDFITHIYGSKFELRSSERSAKKFKVKGTIDL